MSQSNMLEVLKQCFEKIVPSQDGRTTINPLEFIVCLVFCYLGDSKTFTLETIRRFMKSQLNKEISRSAFWERFGRYATYPDYFSQVRRRLPTPAIA